MPAGSSYGWFSDWVDQHLALTLMVGPGPDAADVLDAFGLVEHFSTRGSDHAVLERVTAGGGLAVAMSFTQTINVLMVARDGVAVAGLDIDVPTCRFGVTPHALDVELREAGVLDGAAERPAGACARFLELVTGVVLTQDMLERSLPCATLP